MMTLSSGESKTRDCTGETKAPYGRARGLLSGDHIHAGTGVYIYIYLIYAFTYIYIRCACRIKLVNKYGDASW